uniref:HP domain-containing protein n=1 Tax=Panagrellus redivivus TaxID=6233 RepID=A0A7E4VTH3_PANRE
MTTPDESVRDMEQVRHSIETKELPSSQLQAESQTSSVRIVTPIYKLQEKQPGSEVHMGGNHEHSQRLSAVNGDYKAERSQEEFRMKIIDPKVNSNAHIPSQTGSLPNYGRRLIDDFPSQHGKRSLLKLDPLEQRRIRSVESRPITTSAYLTESVNRHRDMEESKLRKYLKASEDDANKPWNKPDWPGPKNDDGVGESLRELEQIRKKIDLLQMSTFKPTHEDGWLVKIRTQKYLENAKNGVPSRTHSVGELATPRRTSFVGIDQMQTSQTLQREATEYSNQGHPSRGGDELSWQLKKEFHLSKYTVRLPRTDSIGDMSAAGRSSVPPRPDSSMSFMSGDDPDVLSYQVGGVSQLKRAYLEQIRRDEQRHARHRSTPVIGMALSNRVLSATPLVTPSLPDIAEAAHEGSSASSVTTEYAPQHSDRRRSSFVSETQQSHIYRQETDSSRAPTATPLSQQKRSGSQLLYPPGSTDQVASERTPAQRPVEKVVYENKPLPPAVVAVNISQASTSTPGRPKSTTVRQPPPQRRPDDDYAERLMSPPPGRQTPKSILKQSYIHQQHYSDNEQFWEQGTQIQRQMSSDMPEPPAALMQPQQQPQQQQQQQQPNRSANRTPAYYGSSYDLDEGERMRVMRENLQKHRESRNYTPQNVPRYPTTSFNGPFFKLEEITSPQPPLSNGNRPRSQSVAPVMTYESSDQRRYEEEMRFHEEYDRYQYQEMNRMKNMSASEAELDQHIRDNAPKDNNGVVIWPPPQHGRDRPRPASAMARSILDPDRIDAYRKQKQMELEAIRRREERESFLQQRQLHAMQIQQQRVFEQHQQLISEQPPQQRYQPTPQQYQPPPQQYQPPPQQYQPPPQQYLPPPPVPSMPPPQQQQNIPQIHMMSPSDDLEKVEPQQAGDPGMPPPSHMRVFETRPISALSTDSMADPRDAVSPAPLNTWRRTYIVDNTPEAAAKNEILTSEELLEKERFEVDLLKRREAFIEKPEDEPQIFRTGKRWQPPPEKPYIWPTLRRPVTVEPGHEPIVNFAPGAPTMDDNGEYRWQPVVYDPGYKKENKNFTPTNSPPHSPRRGLGTGPLDDVAKRQTKYLVQPSPDGSHRPKPAFKQTRHAPSGGFLPHAPNSVKIVKKRSSQIHNSLSPNFVDQEMADVEVIHERNYHRSEEPSHRRRTPSVSEPRSRSLHDPNHKGPLNDWEKIYDLPPHSSTITNKTPPSNVDVRRRLQLFESQAAASLQRRAYSEQRAVESPQTAASTPKAHQHHEAPPRRGPSNASQRPAQLPNGGTLLRRADSKTEVSHHHNHHHHSSSQRQKPVPRERTTTSSTVAGDAYASRRSSRSGTPQQAHAHYPHAQSSTSSVPMASPMQPQNPSHHRGGGGEERPAQVQRRLQRIIQATSPSPAPPSYERARPYMPPPLPPGYKRPPSPQYGYLQQASPRSPPPQQPGNTRRLVQMVQHEAQRHRHDEQRQARSAAPPNQPEYAPVRSGSGPPPPPPPPQPPQSNYHLGPPNMRYQAVSPASSKYL